jgi:hypothetical protein
MPDWSCPHCRAGYDSGDYPDHWTNSRDSFTFECESCDAEFIVDVDWSPTFRAVAKSTRLPNG